MRVSVVVILTTLAASGGRAATPPWQRTESREPCTSFELFRSPYFGDVHIHTRFSADAYIFGTRVAPRDAYAFARGAAIPFADDDEAQTRSARIDRPLDFAAVTDHAEFFGEVLLCDTPGSLVYDSHQCQLLRQAEAPEGRFPVTVSWLFPAGIPNPQHHAICSEPGVDCTGAAVSVWQEMQAAAEAVYDRTAACAFTSFIGYEYTASPLGRHLHRNVIFRNHHVPPSVASYIETAKGGIPQGFWSAVEDTCLHAGTGCDAVIIPHNSNLSDGMQFFDPADATEALRRQTLEPLVEIHQIKGNSECRFDRLANAGAGTADELCTFEQELVPHQGPGAPSPPPIDRYPLRNMVRNALKDGLAFEDTLGVNPFRFGFVGSTDNHDGAAGSVAETGWAGGQGNEDSSPARQIGNQMRTNPGGLAVAWAEENSRDAIFAALKRRETYATSGTRPVVRFFGGSLPGVKCGSLRFVRDAYARGTPMGGELGSVRGERSPRFAVWAAKDPGTSDSPGTDLQRIQIVKGWVDATGQTHEQVFDVAGDAHNGAGVDPTCAPTGTGARELCTVWRDPRFRRKERAFYYARVLENPTCRWSTRVCKTVGVDPLSSDCAAQAATAGAAFADCCLDSARDPFMDPLVQERAWTSPIWYRPDGIARLRAEVRYGAQPGTDRLVMHLVLGRVPRDLDPQRVDLEVRVGGDDDILALTIPAGRLKRVGTKRFALDGRIGAVTNTTLDLGKKQAELRLATARTDLSHTDRTDHMVTVSLAAGTYRASHTRLWVLRAGRLVPGGP